RRPRRGSRRRHRARRLEVRRAQRRRLGSKKGDVLTSVAETAGRVAARVVTAIGGLTGAGRKRGR
ncbi:MAG: hypothetical protein M3444_20295, partial [Acidobacteriota bacterium]|nr:hypothetical protein [Acidobacteriota bacterium]